MAISRARKEELVTQYTDLLGRSSAMFLAQYTGMSVKQMEALRLKLRDADGSVFVAKNTLIRVALEETGNPVPADLLHGQTVVLFALGEAPKMAQTLIDYAKTQNLFVLRGGVIGGSAFGADQMEAVSRLPTLAELRAQLLGILQAPARQLAVVLQAPAREMVTVMNGGATQLLNVINAYAQKGEEGAAA